MYHRNTFQRNHHTTTTPYSITFHSTEALQRSRDVLLAASTSVKDVVVAVVVDQCALHLDHARAIPRLYRKTNKEVCALVFIDVVG